MPLSIFLVSACFFISPYSFGTSTYFIRPEEDTFSAAYVALPFISPANNHTRISCCPPVVAAAKELLDGFYNPDTTNRWIPFSEALRSVPDDATVVPFDILILGEVLDKYMMDEMCSILPGSKTTQRSFVTCVSDWGSISWCASAPTSKHTHRIHTHTHVCTCTVGRHLLLRNPSYLSTSHTTPHITPLTCMYLGSGC